ncbi:MAG TPA: hypothetical protein VFH78_08045 [Candidatus Thermoplasmatota archaeon]|nr:hypothetical protein [Candidatus Thermoplasmatota archaeon]
MTRHLQPYEHKTRRRRARDLTPPRRWARAAAILLALVMLGTVIGTIVAVVL